MIWTKNNLQDYLLQTMVQFSTILLAKQYIYSVKLDGQRDIVSEEENSLPEAQEAENQIETTVKLICLSIA